MTTTPSTPAVQTAPKSGPLGRLRLGLLRPWPASPSARALVARYRQAGILVRLAQAMRLRICPFEQVLPLVLRAGRVLDLGCGYGILAQLLAVESSARQITGIEQMAERVAVATRVAAGLGNVQFEQGDIHQADFGRTNCIVMNDVLHHVPHTLQIPLLKKCFASLVPGGILLIKDVNKSSLWKYLWNYLHDFARNGNLPFYCLDTPVMVALLDLVGFQVETVALDTGYPYPHVLYVCARP
jgi:SAM-dependent methyltransferase